MSSRTEPARPCDVSDLLSEVPRNTEAFDVALKMIDSAYKMEIGMSSSQLAYASGRRGFTFE